MPVRSVIALFALLFMAVSCADNRPRTAQNKGTNAIRHATGLEIVAYEGYSVVTILNPWPGAAKKYRYVLKKKDAKVPDSLKLPTIDVPVKRIVVTSTTHIPSLEMLGVENSLVGFPNLSYISSEKVRKLIDAGKIAELGANQSLNTEVAIDLQPDVVVGFGINDDNPGLRQLENSGIKVILNGDWNEQTPLGKAEWIKFFGALFGLEERAETLFASIEKDYAEMGKIARQARHRPTVLIGGMFESRWNVPRGDSWGALFIRDAGGKYLWEETSGTGSLSLPLEAVLDKAANAEVWIGPGQYSDLSEMQQANPHYDEFSAFRRRNVYMFRKGLTGGILYYEMAPNRPDLVLRDVVHMLHPELLPGHQLYFFEKLR